MKVTLKRTALQRALNTAVGVMQSRTTAGGKTVSMKATEDGVVLSAQDPGAWIVVRTPKDAVLQGDTGAVDLPGRALLEWVRASEEELVDVAKDQGRVVVRMGKSTASFPYRSMHEISDVDWNPCGARMRVAAPDLKRGLRAVLSAAAKPQIPVLSGVHIRVGEKGVVVLASDKTRAARVGILCEGVLTKAEVTLPVTAVSTLIRTLGAEEGSVDVEVGSRGVLIQTEEWTCFVHGVQVRYPVENVTRALDVARSAVADVDARRFSAALSRMAAIASRDLSAVEIELGNPVRLTSKTDIMRVEEVIEPVRFEGVPVRMGLNVLYLRDVVQAKGSETLRFWVSDEGVAGVTTDWAEYVMAPMVTRWPRKVSHAVMQACELAGAV